MQFFDPSFQNCVNRVNRRPLSYSVFADYKRFEPSMASHVHRFLDVGRLARAHVFFYIVAGVNVLRQMSISSEVTFPLLEAEDSDVDALADRIQAMPWDYQTVHGLLFDYPQNYSYPQAWALATSIVRSYQHSFVVHDDRLVHGRLIPYV